MDMEINFPNLGIYLDHVGKNISIFGFSIAYYGIVIVTGMMIAIWIAQREAKRTGQNPEQYLDLAMIGIAAGILGARIYYVIFAWDYYKDDLLSIFNIRQGGLAIYGGIIGACIAVVIYSRKKKQNFSLLMDTASMSIVFGQIMGRWGNFFNCEAFGGFGVQADTADRGAFGLHGAKGVGAVFYVHGKFEGSRIFADSHIFSSFHNLVLFLWFVTRGYSALFSFYFFIMQLSSRSKLRKEACAL